MPTLRVNLVEFRQKLKRKLVTRDIACRGCRELWGFRVQPQMHEGIFSRNDVAGWPKPWRKLIHCELNCILLCADCNLGLSGKSPPVRTKVWIEQRGIYGEPLMREWLESLPFKIPPNL
jgi:hypothetical protein